MNNLPPPSKNESPIEALKVKIKHLHASWQLVQREKLAQFASKSAPIVDANSPAALAQILEKEIEQLAIRIIAQIRPK